jgi:hypothetical protein
LTPLLAIFSAAARQPAAVLGENLITVHTAS